MPMSIHKFVMVGHLYSIIICDSTSYGSNEFSYRWSCSVCGAFKFLQSNFGTIHSTGSLMSTAFVSLDRIQSRGHLSYWQLKKELPMKQLQKKVNGG